MGLIMPAAETYWNDSMVPSASARIGVVAPMIETGFRGDNNHQMLSFVSNQADEVQFTLQMGHDWKTGTNLFPHVHFCIEEPIADGTYNVQFILEYYLADIDELFPVSPATYTMTKAFTSTSDSHQWMHMLASNASGISNTKHISCVMQCRLYRDNTVANNYDKKVAFLGFDIHYEIDGFGSDAKTSKSF